MFRLQESRDSTIGKGRTLENRVKGGSLQSDTVPSDRLAGASDGLISQRLQKRRTFWAALND